MADKSINQLPVSGSLTDDGLLVVYQSGVTRSIKGELIKQFARDGVSVYVTAAEGAAARSEQAQAAAERARDEAQSIAGGDFASKAYVDEKVSTKQNKLTGTESQVVGFDSRGNAIARALPSKIEVSDTEPTDENVEVWIKLVD